MRPIDHKIDCNLVSELFGDRGIAKGEKVDSEAKGFQFDLVKEHIKNCPHCSSRFGLDLLIVETLKTLPLAQAPGVSEVAVKAARRRVARAQAIKLGAIFVGLFLIGFLLQQNMAAIITAIAKLLAASSGNTITRSILNEIGANVNGLLKLISLISLGPIRKSSIPLINYLIATALLFGSAFVIFAMYMFKRLGLAGSVIIERGQTNGKAGMVHRC